MACDEENIRKLKERVDEVEESRLSVFPGSEPGGMVGHGEGGLGAVGVVPGCKQFSLLLLRAKQKVELKI